jgi:hypothetical protein
MAGTAYRYTFAEGVDIGDVESSLLMAILAAEALYSPAQVRLDAAHFLDADRRMCVITADSEVGRDVARLFVSFLEREFGPTAFTVERVERPFSSAKQAPISIIPEIERHENR